MTDEIAIQRAYYRDTAARYDEMHVGEADEHAFALSFMMAAIEFLGIESVLDIGSGTGRALITLKQRFPGLRIVGVEPSPELRAQGHRKGLAQAELVDGDAQRLAYEDATFDLVCEFGALHHIPDPHRTVDEMLRVARRAVFISDCNNFGQGRPLARAAKQAIDAVGLWWLADLIKTRGKGYGISEGDGLYYSYSVFSDYRRIRKACGSVHLLNTMPAGVNPYRSASHVALLGVKSGKARSLPVLPA